MADNGLERLRQRVHERIIGDFNEFIDDDAIRELINESVQKAFFEKRVEVGQYSRNEKEPLIIEMTREKAAGVVEKQLQKWMTDNEDKVIEIINTTFEMKFAEMIAKAFNRVFEYQMAQFQQSIIDRLQSLGR